MNPLLLTDPSRNSETRIILAPDASPGLRAAAEELRAYLVRITGADVGTVGTKLSIGHDVHGDEAALILLGPSRYTRALRIGTRRLPPEGFRVKRVGRRVVLLGADEAGTLHAMHWFLEEVCGVRWFWPGDVGEDVPRTPMLSVGDIDVVQEPSFRMRHLGHGAGHPSIDVWRRRNRLGGSLRIEGTHSWGKMVPPGRYGPRHPEYFALQQGQRQWRNFNGKHGCQLCTTHPDVLELSVRHVREVFDRTPPEVAYNISPNDGGGFCECPACAALDAGATCRWSGQEIPSSSGQVFTFVNRIAEEVGKTHPGRFLTILAYHAYLDPPPIKGFRLRDNVIVQLCLHGDFDHDRRWRAESERLLRAWKNASACGAIYEYLAWRGNACLPRQLLSTIPPAMRRYHAAGMRLFYSQAYDDFGPNGLNYYLTAKLAWDIDADPRRILDDYYRRCFGGAADDMRRYHELLDARWKHAVRTCGADYYAGSPVYYLAMFPPGVVRDLERLLTAALRKADTVKVAERLRRFRQMLAYVRVTMRALRSLQALQKHGICSVLDSWPSRLADAGAATGAKFDAEWESPQRRTIRSRAKGRQAAAARELVDRAIEAWQQRDACIKSMRDAGLVDYWHLRYDVDRDYRFDPMPSLRELKQAVGT